MILFFKHPDVHIYSIYLLIFQIFHFKVRVIHFFQIQSGYNNYQKNFYFGECYGPWTSCCFYVQYILCVNFSDSYSGTKTNSFILSHHAQEDPELCSQCPSQASDNQCRSGRSCQLRHRTGSGVRQTGGKDGLHSGVSSEDSAPCKDPWSC